MDAISTNNTKAIFENPNFYPVIYEHLDLKTWVNLSSINQTIRKNALEYTFNNMKVDELSKFIFHSIKNSLQLFEKFMKSERFCKISLENFEKVFCVAGENKHKDDLEPDASRAELEKDQEDRLRKQCNEAFFKKDVGTFNKLILIITNTVKLKKTLFNPLFIIISRENNIISFEKLKSVCWYRNDYDDLEHGFSDCLTNAARHNSIDIFKKLSEDPLYDHVNKAFIGFALEGAVREGHLDIINLLIPTKRFQDIYINVLVNSIEMAQQKGFHEVTENLLHAFNRLILSDEPIFYKCWIHENKIEKIGKENYEKVLLVAIEGGFFDALSTLSTICWFDKTNFKKAFCSLCKAPLKNGMAEFFDKLISDPLFQSVDLDNLIESFMCVDGDIDKEYSPVTDEIISCSRFHEFTCDSIDQLAGYVTFLKEEYNNNETMEKLINALPDWYGEDNQRFFDLCQACVLYEYIEIFEKLISDPLFQQLDVKSIELLLKKAANRSADILGCLIPCISVYQVSNIVIEECIELARNKGLGASVDILSAFLKADDSK